jgi:1-acyl-sn-glycerol-3-phosphate acyltransferase
VTAALRSTLFALLFYPGTLVFVLAVIVLAPLGDPTVRAIVHGWARFHHRLMVHVLGIRFVMEGTIPDGPFLIAMKHQSMAEAVDTLVLARTPVVVMKRELSHMPLFGWVARRYGVIGVDREAGPGALRVMMGEAKAAVATGRPVIIFPEGTRVPVGQTPELKPGFAGLYRVLGLAVVPIALDSGRLWPRSFVKQSGVVRLVVGETIPAGLKRAEIERRVHVAINVLERG